MILANEELAEGVFAASGCMKAMLEYSRVDGDNTHRYGIHYFHRAHMDHCATGAIISLKFSAPILVSDSNGYRISGDGTDFLTIYVDNELHSDGDCQTTFNLVFKPVGEAPVSLLSISADDTGTIVDDHIKLN